MIKLRHFVLLSTTSVFIHGCNNFCGDTECRFTVEEWTIVEGLSPLPETPPDPTNKYADDPRAVALGKKLFFEKRYSAGLKIGNDGTNGAAGEIGDTETMGCAMCHIPSASFVDTRSNPNNTSVGVKWTTRNTPTIINVAHHKLHGYAGKQDSLWCQASLSPESGSNSAGNRCGYAHMLFEHYREEYDALFDDPLPTALSTSAPDASRFPTKCKPKSGDAPDGPWEMMTEEDRTIVNTIMANQGKAVAAYERQIISGNAPFDQYVAGDEGAMSDAAKRGLKLFVGKAACVDCHQDAIFTDHEFHNLGVPQEGPTVAATDTGRFDDVNKLLKHAFNSKSQWNDGPDPGKITDQTVQTDDLKGQFRTSMLRNVAQTAPYMHTGSLATLRDVVEFYNDGGGHADFVGEKSPVLVPLMLDDREMDDLVAFLEALTGEPIPDELTSDPFAE